MSPHSLYIQRLGPPPSLASQPPSFLHTLQHPGHPYLRRKAAQPCPPSRKPGQVFPPPEPRSPSHVKWAWREGGVQRWEGLLAFKDEGCW